MIFVVGGTFQGKGAVAMALAREKAQKEGDIICLDADDEAVMEKMMGTVHVLEHVQLLIKREIDRLYQKDGGYIERNEQQKAIIETEIINGVWNGIQTWIGKNDNLIITMDEVGNGVVPMEYRERAYREITGRIGCRLAEEAEEVYQVVCGISRKIK